MVQSPDPLPQEKPAYEYPTVSPLCLR
jgi:hypothetical protein